MERAERCCGRHCSLRNLLGAESCCSSPGERGFARRPIQITESPRNDVVLVTTAGLTVGGEVVFEDPPDDQTWSADEQPRPLRVFLKVGIRLTQVAPISCGSLPANPSDPSALLWGGHHEQRFVLQLATAQALFESAEVAFIDCHSPGQQIPSRCPARSSPRSPRFGTHTQRTAAALFAKATTFHNRNSDSGNRPVSAAGTDTPDRPPHSQNGPRTPSSSEGNLPAPGILHIGAT